MGARPKKSIQVIYQGTFRQIEKYQIDITCIAAMNKTPMHAVLDLILCCSKVPETHLKHVRAGPSSHHANRVSTDINLQKYFLHISYKFHK